MSRILLIILRKTYFLIPFILSFNIVNVSATKTVGDNIKADQYLQEHSKSTTGFIENKGQFTDFNGEAVPFVLFKASLQGTDMYITRNGLTYVFVKSESEGDHPLELYGMDNNIFKGKSNETKERKIEWCRLDMDIVGATIKKENIITDKPADNGVINYYLPHCPDGILNVNTYQKIIISSVYPGIDWIIYSDYEKGLKYDFVVHPGADPNNIKLLYKGAENISATNDGKYINIKTTFGELHEGKIDCYEKASGVKINSNYILKDSTISFDIGNYDISQTLIIDPPLELVWATYYGGSGFDFGYSITNDELGNFFILGISTLTNFPVLNPGGGAYYQGSNVGGWEDLIINKFTKSGQRIWATYYGGSDRDFGISIASDQSGNVFITGHTYSADFPTYNPGGGSYYQDTLASISSLPYSDLIIMKFNNTGQRLWATYYGGWAGDRALSSAIDQAGNVFITGSTGSSDFPVLNPGGGTYFQVPSIGGTNVFILKFNNSGIRLWATTYGGNGSDLGISITTDIFNNVLVTGYTTSTNFPIQDPGSGAYFQDSLAGSTDVFILKFSNSGVRLWATYYGGSNFDRGRSICTDQSGNVFIVGETESMDFPTYNPGGCVYFQGFNAGMKDQYILKFDSACNRQWATYFGGNYLDSYIYSDFLDNLISVDNSGNIFLCFGTSSSIIPTLQSGNCSYFEDHLTDTTDIFIVEFTPDLALYWSTYYHGTTDERGCGVITDTNGCIFIIGSLTDYSVIDVLDPGNGAYFQGTSAGSWDIGIMKFCPCCSYPLSISDPTDVSICTNDSISFSVSASSTDTISYQWFHNGTLLAGFNDSTCIINPVSQNDTGYYYCRISNSCLVLYTDSARLYIKPTFINTIQISICEGDSVFAAGDYQKTSGLYYDSYPCVNYCDSIIITDLSVKDNYNIQINSVICSGDSVLIGGQYRKTTGIYYDSLMSINNCDSIIVTNLSTTDKFIIQTDTMICPGDSVFAAGQYQKSPGIYIDSLLSAANCDSLIYTNLNFYSFPLIDLGNDTIMNIGDSIVLDAGTNYVSYLWSDGSTKQDIIVNTQGLYWVEGTTLCGDVSSDTIIISVGYSINGTLTYANSVMTGMNNNKIYLKKPPDIKADSAISGVAGNYTFATLANGTYFLEPQITKPWGGVNSTDALAIMKHFVGLIYLQGIYLKAADVNATAYVNTADALMVQRRYVGMVSNFPAGDWTWEDNSIVVYGQNINHNLKALCFGDVNGSYIPPQTKQEPGINIIPLMEMTIESFQTFELPFLVEKPLEIGAISLTLEYPSKHLSIEDVELGNGEKENLVFADYDGQIRLSWYNIKPLRLQENDPILIMKFKTRDLRGVSIDKLKFTATGSNELADANAEVIENVNIRIPKFTVLDSPGQYYLSDNYPNPFNNLTRIEYGLKNDGYVSLKVYNVLGEVISELVNAYQKAGHYNIIFDGNELSEGVYFYKILINNNDNSFSKSRRMVISR